MIVLTGDPYDAAGQMPDLGAAAVLDKLDGLNQAREALLGRFRGWKYLGSFFL